MQMVLPKGLPPAGAGFRRTVSPQPTAAAAVPVPRPRPTRSQLRCGLSGGGIGPVALTCASPPRSQSGTGKTATFSISVLQCLDIQVPAAPLHPGAACFPCDRSARKRGFCASPVRLPVPTPVLRRPLPCALVSDRPVPRHWARLVGVGSCRVEEQASVCTHAPCVRGARPREQEVCAPLLGICAVDVGRRSGQI